VRKHPVISTTEVFAELCAKTVAQTSLSWRRDFHPKQKVVAPTEMRLYGSKWEESFPSTSRFRVAKFIFLLYSAFPTFQQQQEYLLQLINAGDDCPSTAHIILPGNRFLVEQLVHPPQGSITLKDEGFYKVACGFHRWSSCKKASMATASQRVENRRTRATIGRGRPRQPFSSFAKIRFALDATPIEI
jgi:hypothetical protein